MHMRPSIGASYAPHEFFITMVGITKQFSNIFVDFPPRIRIINNSSGEVQTSNPCGRNSGHEDKNIVVLAHTDRSIE
jgi:hypothetical protein